MRLSPIVLLPALLSCAGLKPSVTTLRENSWSEVKTPHAIIHTNISPEVAQKMALELEKIRRALLLLWGPEVDPPGQLRIIALKSYGELAHFSMENLGGFYVHDATGPFLVLGADGGHLLGDSAAPESVQVHELAHAVMYGILKRHPRWLAEGLATYLENTRVDADGNVALGKVNVRAYTHVVRGGRVTLHTLREWERIGGLSASDTTDRYATAWAWVHFLFNAHPQPFVAYLQKIASGESDEAAWRASFPVADDELERQLNVYLASGHAAFVTLPLPKVPNEVSVRPLPTASKHATLAHLYVSSPGPRTWEERKSLATAELELALAADAQEPLAKTLQALLAGGDPVVATHGGDAEPPQAPCPTEISADNVIEGTSEPAPRTRVAEFGPGSLTLSAPPGVPMTAVEARAKLASAEVGVFAAAADSAHALVLRADGTSACVVAGWGTTLAGKSRVDSIQSWTAPDRSVAVFVLAVASEATAQTPAETRWITLATDGKRAWAALKGGASAQLIAKEAKLRPQSGKLYLDIKVKGPGATVFAFRPESGQFEQLR